MSLQDHSLVHLIRKQLLHHFLQEHLKLPLSGLGFPHLCSSGDVLHACVSEDFSVLLVKKQQHKIPSPVKGTVGSFFMTTGKKRFFSIGQVKLTTESLEYLFKCHIIKLPISLREGHFIFPLAFHLQWLPPPS